MKHRETPAFCGAFSRPVHGTVPSEIQVVPWGRHDTEKGVFVLDEEGMGAVIADFASRETDMVVDYEHQSLSGREAPAAGWIKRLFAVAPRNPGVRPTSSRAAGIWAKVEWTPRAVEYLKNREYRYLSPVFLKSVGNDRVVKLLSAALTNQPAIGGMVAVVNRDEARCKDRAGAGHPPRPEKTPEGKPERKEVCMKKLYELLGLGEDAGEEQAAAAVQAMKSEVESLRGQVAKAAPNEVLELLGLPDGATLPEVTGTVMALRKGHEQAEELSARLLTLEEELGRKRAGELVARAMRQGKVTAAQKDWAEQYASADPEGFSAFVAKAPVIVHTGEMAAGERPGEGDSPDEVQRAVNQALGVSDDAFRKFGGAR